MLGRTLILLPLLLGTARADQFEIQVYDAETAPPGGFGSELHVNHVVVGSKVADGRELPTHGVTHVTLEPHVGLARWAEVGLYLQSAIHPDGQVRWAGLKLRFKMRIPRRLLGGLLGFALNQEIAFIPAAYEATRYGWEARPIVDLQVGRLYLAFNPILEIAFTGPHAGEVEIEPALKGSVRIVDWLAIGVEYYAGLGRIVEPDPRREQVHRLYGVLDLAFARGKVRYDLNIGAGYDFGAGDPWIVKAIFAVDYEP